MLFEIKNRFNDAVLFSKECESIRECVIAAVEARANLARANLEDANLADANLARANLAGANLAGAYLAGANLADANLAGANLAGAYLAGAYLADAYLAGANLAGANLAGANLAGAYLARANLADAYLADADLARANLAGADKETKTREQWLESHAATDAEKAAKYRERHPEVPVIENLNLSILLAIEAGGELEMGTWHTCETTHCRAGWAIHLAGAPGRELESRIGSAGAGAAIYRASTGRVPHFYASNESALSDLRASAVAEQSP